MQRLWLSTLAVVALLVPQVVEAGPAQGDLKLWHRVELVFAGPSRTESSNSPNAFLDYRLICRLTAPSGKTYDVPGFFDGDGAGGSSGSVWICRFSPDETGTWRYSVSFRTGPQVAVSSNTGAGAPTAFNGASGSFPVAPSDKVAPDFRAASLGRLQARGRYLTFAGSGKAWLKGGTNIPENLLGYRGFDNTPTAGHDFDAHVKNWKAGDPDWGNGKGKGIIGALNWLAAAGANSVYFLPMNIGGDAKDTFPTIAEQDKTHYDTSKLRQWETVFAHCDRLGIFLHFQLAETESANENYHDAGQLSTQRKLYYRELIARFGHHLGVEWDLGEENDYTTQRRKEFAAYIAAVDPYDHPITNHNKSGQIASTYDPLLGNPNFTMTAFQGGTDVIGKVAEYRARSTAVGVPWVVSFDEPQSIHNDAADQQNGYPHGRRDFMWPTYIAGGGGFEWYVQEDGGGHGFDQRIDDMRPLADALAWTRNARTFLETLPLSTMVPHGSLSETGAVLARRGDVYAIYDRQGGTVSLDLTGAAGRYDVRWFDPRTGSWHPGATVVGGAKRNLGSAPFSGDSAVLVTAVSAPATTTTTNSSDTTTTNTTGTTSTSGTTSTTLAPTGECPSEPLLGCKIAESGRMKLVQRRSGPRLSWRWISSVLTPHWGDPRSATSYNVCVFDTRAGVHTRAMDLGYPVNGHWFPLVDGGYKYNDIELARYDGLRHGLLKTTRRGRTKISARASGERLAAPAHADTSHWLHQLPKVVVQLVDTDGNCWETTFGAGTVRINTHKSFTAKTR